LVERKPDRFAAELPGQVPEYSTIGIAGVIYSVLDFKPSTVKRENFSTVWLPEQYSKLQPFGEQRSSLFEQELIVRGCNVGFCC